uniref:Uncharacterized protein n=1 Tax=Setaria viridis TaxID=4556 RepID=A0A4U6UAR8_SETVI|nr:hypothetical protein SEVIR_6G175100v2 [Setaria viridis]
MWDGDIPARERALAGAARTRAGEGGAAGGGAAGGGASPTRPEAARGGAIPRRRRSGQRRRGQRRRGVEAARPGPPWAEPSRGAARPGSRSMARLEPSVGGRRPEELGNSWQVSMAAYKPAEKLKRLICCERKILFGG